MSVLRGPADPDAFRTTVNRARWYHDPLPACDVAAASDDKYPAISTAKKSWTRTFTKRWEDGNAYELDHLRIAEYVDGNLEVLAKMPRDERVPLMLGAPGRDLNRAADRGTDVHTFIERLCGGEDQFAQLERGAGTYMDVCRKLVADLAPEIVAAETVAFARALGVAGTFDCVARIHGRTYMVDWKSRGVTSSHAAYEGEAAQIGAYTAADYWVIDSNGAPARMVPPHIDGGLIVSIRPDSYECFPIELTAAQEAAAELVATWRAKRQGEKAARTAIGKPVVLGVTPNITTDDTLEADLEASLAAVKAEPFTTAHEEAQLAAAEVVDLFAPRADEPVKLGDVLPGVVADLDPSKASAPVEDLFNDQRGPYPEPPQPVDPISTPPADTVDLFATPKAEPEPVERDNRPGDEQRALWLYDRVKGLEHDQRARVLLGKEWPTGVESPAGWKTWTVSDLDDINLCLTFIEAELGIPFPETSDPAIEHPEPTPQPAKVPPLPTPNETSGKVDPEKIAAGEAAAAALPTHKFAHGAGWRQQHKLTGRTWPRGTSRRGFAVATAAIACLTHLWDDDDPDALTRAAVTTVLDLDRLPDGWETGAILGSLSTPQADRLTQLAEAAASDETVLADLGQRVTAA